MVERHFWVEVMGSRPILFFIFIFFWRYYIMEDIMHIQSAFLRGLISDAVRNAIRKRGYDGVTVDLNDISAGYSENDKKVHVHLNIDAEMSKNDLVDILRSIDIL